LHQAYINTYYFYDLKISDNEDPVILTEAQRKDLEFRIMRLQDPSIPFC